MTAHKVERPLILVPGILESSLAIKKDPEFYGIWPLKPWIPNYDFLDGVLSDLGNNIRTKVDEDSPVVPAGLLPGFFENLISAIINKWKYQLESSFWSFHMTGDSQMKFQARCWLNSLKRKIWIALILSVIQWVDL
jgi:hypothetical protein